MTKLCFDFETSTHSRGNAFDSRNKAVSYSVKKENESLVHRRFDDIDFVSCLSSAIASTALLIGQNLKFDIHWLRKLGVSLPDSIRVWDTQLAEFILSGQTNSFASLNELAEKYGFEVKLDAVADYWDRGVETADIPAEILQEYNDYDVQLTYNIYEAQLKDPRMTKEIHRLIILSGLDLLVLEDMEYNGIKYDKEASLAEAEKLTEELSIIRAKLDSYSGGINYNSGDQLSCFLFGGTYEQEIRTPETRIYKSGPRKGQEYVADKIERRSITLPGYFRPDPKTELAKTKDNPTATTRYYSTAADTLSALRGRSKAQKSIVEYLGRLAYIEKLVGTYLKALPELMDTMHWGDYLHGQFNQVVARTGRLSSSKPNLQNTSADVDQYIVSRYA